jgi:RNA polymerase sigma factor (sigma-70 family)
MDSGPLQGLLRHLRRVVGPGDEGRTDAQLLERFARARDEAAFELLLRRHGPMVLGVCRRVLRQEQDAEDAFQATFLTLARKAGSIGKGEALAGWLARVAYRAALRARSAAQRCPAAGLAEPEPPAAGPAGDRVEQDVRPILDEELQRLPEKYRTPVVLCYLEGVSYEEAARRLGWPAGTVATRLRRARELLRRRLARRGLAVSAGAAVPLLTQAAAPAEVPAALLGVALDVARLGPAGGATARALALSEGVCRTMVTNKLRAAAAALGLTVALLGAGTGVLLRRAPAGGEGAPAALPPKDPVLIRVGSEVDGVLELVGTEVKKGEKVDPARVVTVRVGGEPKKYRRLREGDAVEEGQLLARLDDGLAREEVDARIAALEAAEAEGRAAVKTKDEASRRVAEMDARRKVGGARAVSVEEYQGALLVVARYNEEVIVSAARARRAKAELGAARTVLALYELRSPVGGVIETIARAPGEAVQTGETVVVVRKVSAAGAPVEGPKRVAIPARRTGKLVVVGRPLRPGEAVAKEKVVVAEVGFLAVQDGPRSLRPWKKGEALVAGKLVVGRKQLRFRELEVGDKVEAGQAVGLVASALAADHLAAKVAKLDAAEADARAAVSTQKEAERRLAALEKLRRRRVELSEEEYRGAKLTAARYAEEASAKAAQVKAAQAEVRAAALALEMHEVRSPVAGTVTAIYRRRGEVVKALGPVLQVQSEAPAK